MAELFEPRSLRTASASRPFVSLIVPAFNEGPDLAANLEAILCFLASERRYEFEVLVVDDGSSDGTYDAALDGASRHPNLRVVRHTGNAGLGAAIRTGFAFAQGEILIAYDSDMSYELDVIPEMLNAMELLAADLVLASPYMRGGSVKNVPFLRRLLSREANRFLSFAANGKISTITSMVRAYRADFFRAIPTYEQRMEFNPEVLFKAIKSEAKIAEIPAQLRWSAERARTRSRLNLARTCKQVGRTLRYGIAHRPAVLLALPGILPGVLPLIWAILAFMHASLKTVAIVTLVTMIIQNTSLALFAGQLTVFGRNVVRRGRRAQRPREPHSEGPPSALRTQDVGPAN